MPKMPMIVAASALLVFTACRSSDDRSDDSDYRTPSKTSTTQTKSSDRDRSAGQIEASAGRTTAKISNDDRTFVMEAASGGRFEVESSQLALQKTQNQELRQFAQRMIDDHSRANRELESLASRKGISLVQAIASEHAMKLDRLRGLNATEFEREYRQVQTDAHREAVDLFERASRDASDPDLKAFAQKTLPTLRAHVAHIQEMDGANIR
jgi:putative membrane protein